MSVLIYGRLRVAFYQKPFVISVHRAQSNISFASDIRAPLGRLIHPNSRSTMSSSAQPKPESFRKGKMLHGRSGRAYIVEEVLAEREGFSLSVYKANCVGFGIDKMAFDDILTERAKCRRKGIHYQGHSQRRFRISTRTTNSLGFMPESPNAGRHYTRIRNVCLSFPYKRPAPDQKKVLAPRNKETNSQKCAHWDS
jgi:hypothetical protein